MRPAWHRRAAQALAALVCLLLPAASAWAATSLDPLPARFAGTLPCADCPGIDYRLDLDAGGVFASRMTYRDRGPEAVRDEIGAWALDPATGRLELRSGSDAPTWLRVVDGSTLRLLDGDGHDIVSDLDYALRRDPTLPPLEPRLALRGMYRHLADTGRFLECRTRRSLPVAQEGDNAALERGYLDARDAVGAEPGTELLAEVQGRIAQRPRMEGGGTEATLVVERFLGVWPGESCGSQLGSATLEGTYWKLTRLRGQPVTVAAGGREPHLVFQAGEKRFAGSGGCNRLIGSYRLDGATLELGQAASTMMACAEGMATEHAFTTALAEVRGWKITGEQLELLADDGSVLLRFEARYLN